MCSAVLTCNVVLICSAVGSVAVMTLAVAMGACELLVQLMAKRGTAVPAVAAMVSLHASTAPPSLSRIAAVPGLMPKVLGLAALVAKPANDGGSPSHTPPPSPLLLSLVQLHLRESPPKLPRGSCHSRIQLRLVYGPFELHYCHTLLLGASAITCRHCHLAPDCHPS